MRKSARCWRALAPENPYKAWIETYTGPEYTDSVARRWRCWSGWHRRGVRDALSQAAGDFYARDRVGGGLLGNRLARFRSGAVNIEFLFPVYSKAERAADAVVHIIGVPLGLIAAVLLVHRALPHGPVGKCRGGGLLRWAGWDAWRFRRLSAQPAGAYQGISAPARPGHDFRHDRGNLHADQHDCALWAFWPVALPVVMVFGRDRHFPNPALSTPVRARDDGALYGHGLDVARAHPVLFLALVPDVLVLILIGGIAYTIGAVVQGSGLKFHNPLWHVLVLVAAALHYAAISLQLTGGVFRA